MNSSQQKVLGRSIQLDTCHILYNFRIVAQNQVGSSAPSDTITVETSWGKPSGPPLDYLLSAVDQHTVIVDWNPPLKENRNGDILGYYVYYKKTNKGDDEPYHFETVEPWQKPLNISNLGDWKEYDVIVRAFNKIGPSALVLSTKTS